MLPSHGRRFLSTALAERGEAAKKNAVLRSSDNSQKYDRSRKRFFFPRSFSRLGCFVVRHPRSGRIVLLLIVLHLHSHKRRSQTESVFSVTFTTYTRPSPPRPPPVPLI